MVQFILALFVLIVVSQIPAVASIAADIMDAVTSAVGILPVIAIVWAFGYLSTRKK